MLVDAHTHLEARGFDADRAEVVARAADAGVAAIVTVGTSVRDCRKAIALTKQFATVYACIGIHPHDSKGIDGETYGAMRQMAREEKVVAYGEIGLDFFHNHSPREVQLRRFGEQIELAAELGLPIVIHDRDAHKETLGMLTEWKGGGVFHCFSGDYRMAKTCLDMGFYLSVPGTVTFEKADMIRDVVARVPLERLLVETDAPWLTPQPFRGKRNEPAYVLHTARKVAEIKRVPLEEVGRVTTNNVKEVFGIDVAGLTAPGAHDGE